MVRMSLRSSLGIFIAVVVMFAVAPAQAVFIDNLYGDAYNDLSDKWYDDANCVDKDLGTYAMNLSTTHSMQITDYEDFTLPAGEAITQVRVGWRARIDQGTQQVRFTAYYTGGNRNTIPTLNTAQTWYWRDVTDWVTTEALVNSISSETRAEVVGTRWIQLTESQIEVTYTPEPTSALLLGWLGLGFVGRRRKRVLC